MIYDSDIDGKDKEVFQNRIIGHEHVYFIVIDADFNVFGNYCDSKLVKSSEWVHDPHHFLITLNTNGRCGMNKYPARKVENGECCVNVFNEHFLYQCGSGFVGGYTFFSFGCYRCIITDISSLFDGIRNTDLTGEDCTGENVSFTPKRLVVIEMK